MNLRETIIHESQKLFSLNGFLSTGINDIIKASETSKGGFYNHFASKEELFYEVLAEAQKIWRDKVLLGVRDLDSPTNKLKLIYKNYGENYLRDSENFPGGCVFITLSIELDDQRPHLMKEITKGFNGFVELLNELLDEGIEAREISPGIETDKIANFLFTSMLGVSVLFGVEKSVETLDRLVESLTAYLDKLRI
jgi:TetR/AcrR family transcriptional repressor of nem operon